jgi:hypothetical protein
MLPHVDRPYAAKSTEELRVIRQVLGEQLNALGHQRSAIENELALRDEPTLAEHVIDDLPGSGAMALQYKSPRTRPPVVGMIADSYAEECRRYGFKMTLLLCGVIVAAVTALFMLGALMWQNEFR